ncbi:MAG: hypothetical protein ACYCV7_16645, partial [Acidimicrobiales bacterium]
MSWSGDGSVDRNRGCRDVVSSSWAVLCDWDEQAAPVTPCNRDSAVSGMDQRSAVLAAVGLGRGGEWAFGRHGYTV